MLKILDEKEKRSEKSIMKEYKDCMFIITNYGDLQNPIGNLYCISTQRDSYHDICKVADELEQKDIPCILAGSYKESVGPGLVYEIKEA